MAVGESKFTTIFQELLIQMFKRNKFNFIFLLTLIGIFATFAAAQNTITYVAANSGNDANTCIGNSPCQTIAKAMSVTVSGGRVVLTQNGSYEPVTVDRPLTIAAADGVHATIVTDNVTNIGVSISGLLLSDVVTVKNLHFTGGLFSFGIYAAKGGVVNVDNCEFNGLMQGVTMDIGRGVYIHNSTFRNNGRGVLVTGGRGEVTKVVIDSSTFESNQFGANFVNKVNAAIRNSTFSNHSTNGIAAKSNDITLFGEMLIDNCQIFQNVIGVNVSIEGRGSEVARLSRSTFTNNTSNAVYSGAATTVYSMGDNVFAGNLVDVAGVLVPLAAK